MLIDFCVPPTALTYARARAVGDSLQRDKMRNYHTIVRIGTETTLRIF